MIDNPPIRINKYLSEIGYCSRRAADKLIEQGRITVNGKDVVMGLKVTAKDLIAVDGIPVEKSSKKSIYIAFNKPVGIVCTTDTRVEKDNIIDYINFPTRIFPIGRLDKPSEGLIFLTNDGDIVNKILRAKLSVDSFLKIFIFTISPILWFFVFTCTACIYGLFPTS